jgi:hypothetical protein
VAVNLEERAINSAKVVTALLPLTLIRLAGIAAALTLTLLNTNKHDEQQKHTTSKTRGVNIGEVGTWHQGVLKFFTPFILLASTTNRLARSAEDSWRVESS